MTRDEFGDLIDRAKADADELEALLTELEPAAIESFQLHFDELYTQAYRWALFPTPTPCTTRTS